MEFLLRDLSMIINGDPSKTRDDYVNQLEDELTKIDAFKRELPLSRLLVTDAIVRLKEETLVLGSKGKVNNLNYDGDEIRRAKLGKDDKKSWMSSVWTTDPPPQHHHHHSNRQEGNEEDNIMELSLMLPNASKSDSINAAEAVLPTNPNQQQRQPTLSLKKQRRSWSQELHRRFMNALQQLGGAQVATPKQIKDLMQVDGLTNDEVKSHLQKYRLHIRKVPFSDTTPNGLYTSDDQNGSNSKASNTQSSSPLELVLMNESAKGCDTMYDEEDEKTEGHSWKSKFFMPINVL